MYLFLAHSKFNKYKTSLPYSIRFSSYKSTRKYKTTAYIHKTTIGQREMASHLRTVKKKMRVIEAVIYSFAYECDL